MTVGLSVPRYASLRPNYRTNGLEGMLDYLQLFLHFTHEEPQTQGTQVHLTAGDRKKVVRLQKVKRECGRGFEWLQGQVNECVDECVGGGGEKGGRVEGR